MTPEERRLKEIKHRRYEIIIMLKELKKELIKLKKDHESPTNPGYIYASAIDEHLKEKYMT